MNNTKILLSVEHLKKYYPVGRGGVFSKKKTFVQALEDVSFQVERGETFAIVGESGSGKSTLGKVILQLEKATSGKVFYHKIIENSAKLQENDENIQSVEKIELTTLDKKKMRDLRKDLQIVFQDPYSSLNPKMTVGQIIEEGVATHKFYKKGSAQMREYVAKIMEDCGLQAYTANRYPHEFSGGQRQRVCIARALAVKPKFIVCDECVSALDVSVQSQILNLLADLKEKEKLTYLFISHDLSVVRKISDKIAVTYWGEMVETGETKEIFTSPSHPYTIALLSAMPSLSPFKKERKILLGASAQNPVFPPKACRFHPRCFMAQEICRTQAPPFVEVKKGHFSRCHFAKMSVSEKRANADREQGVKNQAEKEKCENFEKI